MSRKLNLITAPRMSEPWTETEDNLLRQLYPKNGTNEIAMRLNRSHGSVFARAKKLGVKWIRRWTPAEDELLRKIYPSEGVSTHLQQTLDRTIYSIDNRARYLGLVKINKNKSRWTEQEIKILIERYPVEGASQALQNTLGRSRNGIIPKARSLGLFISADVWSKIHTKIARIGKHNENFKGYEGMPGHFIASIRQDAKKRNIVHPLLNGTNESNKYLWDLYVAQDGKCALTGEPILFRRSYSDGKNSQYEPGSASLDRVDSSKGYIIGNVQWVHKHVNVMKRALSQEEFIQLANKIARRHPRE